MYLKKGLLKKLHLHSSICCFEGFCQLLNKEKTLIEHISKIPDTLNFTRTLYISYHDTFMNTEKNQLFEKCKVFTENIKRMK